jgi:hypothetical protein
MFNLTKCTFEPKTAKTFTKFPTLVTGRPGPFMLKPAPLAAWIFF